MKPAIHTINYNKYCLQIAHLTSRAFRELKSSNANCDNELKKLDTLIDKIIHDDNIKKDIEAETKATLWQVKIQYLIGLLESYRREARNNTKKSNILKNYLNKVYDILNSQKSTLAKEVAISLDKSNGIFKKDKCLEFFDAYNRQHPELPLPNLQSFKDTDEDEYYRIRQLKNKEEQENSATKKTPAKIDPFTKALNCIESGIDEDVKNNPATNYSLHVSTLKATAILKKEPLDTVAGNTLIRNATKYSGTAKTGWKIAGGIFMFLGVALIVGGALAAPGTFGTSAILGITLGTTLLAKGAILAAGVAGLSSFLGGAFSFWQGTEKGLVKKIHQATHLQQKLKEKNKKEFNLPDDYDWQVVDRMVFK